MRRQPDEKTCSQAGGDTAGMVYLGCAGWSLSTAVQENFPLQGSHLERYAAVLSAVEINSSFYRPHRATTYSRWRDSVPAAFRFSVKVPKKITHTLRLRDVDDELQEFLDAVHHLAEKLGCLLVQLPPSLAYDALIAAQFFDKLRASTLTDIVCEPRHPTWFFDAATRCLARLKIARVIADPPAVAQAGLQPEADTVYIRLHGSPVIYHSAYSIEYLQQLSTELIAYRNKGRRVWCIFDNTASGAAIPNVLSVAANVQSPAAPLFQNDADSIVSGGIRLC